MKFYASTSRKLLGRQTAHQEPELGKNDENPAVNLPSDILLEIFAHNSMLYPPEYLSCPSARSKNCIGIRNLRRVSQVCSTWRTLVLASSLLWARSICLNELCTGDSDEKWSALFRELEARRMGLNAASGAKKRFGPILWMNEVLRRTQQSPLWISGYVNTRTLKILTNHLLRREWYRIARVQVRIINDNQPNDTFEDLITWPAPFLQHFDLELNINRKTVWAVPPSSVFGNYAPSLTHVVIANFGIDSRASWFTHLRYIQIHVPTTHLEILQIIRKAPWLEDMRIGTQATTINLGNEDDTVILPYIHHSQLRYIELFTVHIASASLLFQHIILNHACTTRISCCQTTSNDRSIGNLNAIHVDTMATCAQQFTQHSRSTYSICLTVSVLSTTPMFKIEFVSNNIVSTLAVDREEDDKLGLRHQFYFDFRWHVNTHRDIIKEDMSILIQGFSFDEIARGVTQFEYIHHEPTVLDAVINSFAPLLFPAIKVLTVRKPHLLSLFEPYLLLDMHTTKNQKSHSRLLFAELAPRLRKICLCDSGPLIYRIKGGDVLEEVLASLVFPMKIEMGIYAGRDGD